MSSEEGELTEEQLRRDIYEALRRYDYGEIPAIDLAKTVKTSAQAFLDSQ